MSYDKFRESMSIAELVEVLLGFLEDVFGRDFLVKGLELLKKKPRGRVEEYQYLREVNVHRAVRWYCLLKTFRDRGYRFDLRFSVEVREFMNLMIFYYTFKHLLDKSIVDLSSRNVQGRLHGDPGQFDDFTHEVLVASNYASNNFRTEMPDASGSGIVDVYAEKGSIKIWCECKRIRREEVYNNIVIELLRWLHKKNLI